MAEQVRRKYTAKQTRNEQSQVEEVQANSARESNPSKEETDALLDDIEGVLETNASEFVRDFVQRGGQ